MFLTHLSDNATFVSLEGRMGKKSDTGPGETVRVALRLDKESVEQLEWLETNHGVNFSAAVRLAVKAWLATHPLLKGKKA
jgi:hypothetical protein